MEEATLRCRDIIQNLLGFARLRQSQGLESTDLRESIERAVKLTALQTKSKDIPVTVAVPSEPAMAKAQANSLTQALCNILQNSIDAVLERRKTEKRSRGGIAIELKQKEISTWILSVCATKEPGSVPSMSRKSSHRSLVPRPRKQIRV